jgi:hypothetical protein
MFVRQRPAERGLQPDGDPEPPDLETAEVNQERRGPLEVDRWAESFRSPPIWQMSGSYFVCGATTFLLSVHFVPYAIDRGVSPGLAATIFGLMSGLMGTLSQGIYFYLIGLPLDVKEYYYSLAEEFGHPYFSTTTH